MEIRRNIESVARFTISPPSGRPGTVFRFDASGSEDFDGRIKRYQWDFGDPTRTEGKEVTHSYRHGGLYQVRLTVVDNTGERGVAQRTMEIERKGGGETTGSRSPRSGIGPLYLFTVLEANGSTRTIQADFDGNPGCAPYYRCGDIRKGGLPGGSPGKEKWIGTLCRFTRLNDGTALIQTVPGNYWPRPGRTLYLASTGLHHCGAYGNVGQFLNHATGTTFGFLLQNFKDLPGRPGMKSIQFFFAFSIFTGKIMTQKNELYKELIGKENEQDTSDDSGDPVFICRPDDRWL